MSSPAELARALAVKAEDDQYVLQRLAGDARAPAWVLGFHAQQAVEKALKAVLTMRGIEFPRTHNLSMLLELLRRAGVPLPPAGDDLVRLIPFGVALRYEDAVSSDEAELDRKWALDAVSGTLLWAKDVLVTQGSPPQEQD
jgi:HEPN domain-containing protein